MLINGLDRFDTGRLSVCLKNWLYGRKTEKHLSWKKEVASRVTMPIVTIVDIPLWYRNYWQVDFVTFVKFYINGENVGMKNDV